MSTETPQEKYKKELPAKQQECVRMLGGYISVTEGMTREDVKDKVDEMHNEMYRLQYTLPDTTGLYEAAGQIQSEAWQDFSNMKGDLSNKSGTSYDTKSIASTGGRTQQSGGSSTA
jgi:hypothetical protein